MSASPDANDRPYGTGDASFRAAGGEEGLRALVTDFYELMSTRDFARRIRDMHPSDLDVSIDKLARFLCGWLGGPKRYAERYGPIRLPRAHAHLPIDADDRDAWLRCMALAIARQPWDDAFKTYLLGALRVPAERIRAVCEEGRGGGAGGGSGRCSAG